MKLLQPLLQARFVRTAAGLMRWVCFLVMVFFALCLVLSLLGRQTFRLHTSTGTYSNAIYAEDDHTSVSRFLTISTADDIFVRSNSSDGIDLATRAALFLITAVQVVPLTLAYWFLSRVFAGVAAGRIFTQENASCLLCYGVIQFCTALCAPFLKLLIVWAANLLAESQIALSTGAELFSQLIPSLAFLVAAYILHYGTHLQDEVDHTL